MLRDDEAFPMAARTYTVDVDEITQGEGTQAYPNDDFDDVFGSAPPSPTFEQDEREDNDTWRGSGGNLELSDVPRLKEKHETEGYRDGVTRGKAETVQAGFDEGYGLGAVLGLRIGKILGLLEGICQAVSIGAKTEGGEVWKGELERVEGLLAGAKAELKTESVFGREWWGEDGIWKFKVPGESLEGKEVTFPDVAGAHPLVAKWEQTIQAEIQKWGLDLGLMETEIIHEEKHEEIQAKVTEAPRAGMQKAEFSW
jgi:hypothetical protein